MGKALFREKRFIWTHGFRGSQAIHDAEGMDSMPTGAHIMFIQEAEGTFEGGLVYNLQRHAPVGCCHQLIPHPLKVPSFSE